MNSSTAARTRLESGPMDAELRYTILRLIGKSRATASNAARALVTAGVSATIVPLITLPPASLQRVQQEARTILRFRARRRTFSTGAWVRRRPAGQSPKSFQGRR